MSWDDLAGWWRSELEADPAYDEVTLPLLVEILQPRTNGLYLDLGSGEGRVMRALEELGARCIGIDISPGLAASTPGRVVVADLTRIPLRDGCSDGAFAVLVLEHVADDIGFFAEAHRVVGQGGTLAVVSNHPTWTAPDSTPIADTDGEVLWRPGRYFERGVTEYDTGEGTIVFHHRSMSQLLNTAADTGWALEHMVETPHHDYRDQAGIPRLLACRWRRG